MEQNRLYRSSSLTIKIVLMTALAPVVFMLGASSLLAENGVDVEAIRKDLLAAKASGSAGGSLSTRSGDAFSLKPEDLEKRRAALLAEENALLSELQNAPDTSMETVEPPVATEEATADRALANNSEITSFGADPASKVALPGDDSSADEHATEDGSTAEANTLPEAAPKAELASASADTKHTKKVKVATKKSDPDASSETKADISHASLRASDLEKMKAVASSIESTITNLQKSNTALEAQLRSVRIHSADLQKEFEETRDRLMIADAEVERLSGQLKARNQQTLTQMAGPIAVADRTATAQSAAPVAMRVVKKTETRVAEDVLIGTVVADKANLRTGAGKDNSPFMTVSKGTRLTVETRDGDWYRVIAPNGTRAWVSSEVLAFGENSQASPTNTLRIKGYDASLEEQAFKLISNRPH